MEKTFDRFRAFLDGQENRLERECHWLKKQSFDLVICDIPSFPLKAARMADIPSILVANFAGYNIYSTIPLANCNTNLIDILCEEHSSASIHFTPQFEVENGLKAPKRVIGFMGLKGKNVRNELGNYLRVKPKHKTLIFIYLGNYDLSILQWHNLEKVDDCIFITRNAHACPPQNLSALDAKFTYSDLIASSHLIATKFGYSMLACTFHHGKRVIICDWEEFFEAKMIRQFLIQTQSDLVVSKNTFNTCDRRSVIKQAKFPLRIKSHFAAKKMCWPRLSI